MAKRKLTEDEFLEELFSSSDEDEPSTVTFKADSVHDDLHDALTWQQEEEDTQVLDAQLLDVGAAEVQDLATSHTVHLHSRVRAAPSASPAAPSASPAAPSASPAPPSASAVPRSASPAPPSASPESALSPVELKSRKRRRGPLRPAEGVALKILPDDSYRSKDKTKWYSVPNPSMPPIMPIDEFEDAGPTMAVFGCRTPAEAFAKFMPDVLLAEVVVHTNDKIVTLRNRCKRQCDPTFKNLSLMELRAFLGILIMTGARKDNHLQSEEMFSRSQGCPFYRSVMSERRFAFI